MVVIKRDGREVDFDKGKIANAILKAFTEVEKLSAVGDKNEVPKKISTRTSSIAMNMSFCGTLLLWTAKSSLLRITSMKQSSRRTATKIPQSSLLRETISPAR